MRNDYDYPDGDHGYPGETARDEGLRRLRTLTWRTAQLGALATVGFATVFARTAPAQTASQTVPAATPAPGSASAGTAGSPKSAATASSAATGKARRKASGTGAAAAARHRGRRDPGADRHAGRSRDRSANQRSADHGSANQGRAHHRRADHPGTAGHHPGAGADHRVPGADRHEHVARGELMPAASTGHYTGNALGTFATLLVSDPDALPAATEILAAELAAIDLACSRFRPDSELWRACSAGGRPVEISPLFATALEVALSAARLTDGDVDPTCGRSLAALGYDRDFALARQDTSPASLPPVAAGGWRAIRLDTDRGAVTVPDGVLLDLGATAKALAADRAAAAIAAATDSGVLVNLGGDISVAGPAPDAGWLVGVADDARFDTTTDTVRTSQSVVIRDGALATSSVLGRSWRRGGTTVHHIVAPRTGLPARSCWRTVTVAAETCVAANIAATAAIVRGAPAADWLRQLCLPARLVGQDGSVTAIAGWPAEPDFQPESELASELAPESGQAVPA